jgi:3-methyladenine DNA glycosylase Tag
MGYVIPPRVKPDSDEDYFEQLTKAVFQAGFSFKVVEQKWPDISEVFERFDFKKLAIWDEEKISSAIQNPKIIRNIKKIRGIVYNAQIFMEIVSDHGSFDKFLATTRSKPYKEFSTLLTKKFKWLGRTGAYVFLWCVNEEVPEWVER